MQKIEHGLTLICIPAEAVLELETDAGLKPTIYLVKGGRHVQV